MDLAWLSPRSRAVFLDRDGVLNRAVVRDGVPHPPASLDELEVFPEAPEACRRLRRNGFVTVLVTNQPDIARCTTTREQVDAIHRQLASRIPLDDIRVCPHDDQDGCACRKPAPGMLLDAAAALGLDLPSSVMVGDRWRDVEAGRRAGCRTVMIDHRYAETRRVSADLVTTDIAAAAGWILSQQPKEGGRDGHSLAR